MKTGWLVEKWTVLEVDGRHERVSAHPIATWPVAFVVSKQLYEWRAVKVRRLTPLALIAIAFGSMFRWGWYVIVGAVYRNGNLDIREGEVLPTPWRIFRKLRRRPADWRPRP